MPEDQMSLQQFGATIKAKYPAYASKSDEEIGKAMLAKYPQYASRVKQDSGAAEPQDWRDRILSHITTLTPEQKKKLDDFEAKGNIPMQGVKPTNWLSGLADIGLGAANAVGTAVLHPSDTAHSVGHTLKTFLAIPGSADQAKAQGEEAQKIVKDTVQQAKDNPTYFLGQQLGGLALGEAGGAALEAGAKGAGAAGRGIKTAGGKGLRTLTRTGTGETAKFVSDVARSNEDAIKETAAKNAKVKERTDDINARRKDAYDQRKAQYDTKKAAYDEAQAKAAEVEKASQETATRRGELARQTKQNSARLIERVKTVAKQVKGQIDENYAQIRKATGPKTNPDGTITPGLSVPASDLRSAVETAQSKLKGSAESIKQFKDILSKAPEEDGPIEYQGASIPKGHALYDVLAEGMDTGKPFSFEDLRGYYSEIGEKLAPGALLPDVYQALKSLQDSLNGMQKNLATKAGVGAKFTSTQARFSDYLKTFREAQGPNHSGSPIAQALQAKDPTFAIKPLSNADTAARVRSMLARFDPAQGGVGGAAQLYDNFLKANRELDGLAEPKGVGKALTPPTPPIQTPALTPRLEKANVQVISPETLQQMKAGNAIQSADRVANSSSQFANTLAVVGALRSAITGDLTGLGIDIAVRSAYGVGKSAFAKALADPAVVNMVAKLTPEDVAQAMRLPESQRTGFVDLVKAAEEKGIKLNPQVLAMVKAGGPAASVAGQKKGVAAALTPPTSSQ